MAITIQANSKSNVRQNSAADLLANLSQPVISRYNATSTAGQTVINLPFIVDQSNTDACFVIVDGKKLTIGSSNDYTFTSIDGTNSSSQITLNQSLVAGLNIEVFKMGLKKEVENLTDARFTQMYDLYQAGFQGFVDESSRLTAISSGTPTSTQFRSSIVGRASIPDLANDLKPRMAIERVMTQQISQLEKELGTNNEFVWAAANDDRGLIRFVGSWTDSIDSDGQSITTINTTDFVEITFYGTGLNLLCRLSTASLDMRATVDDGAEGSNIFGGVTFNSILAGRKYSSNQVVSVASGLTLGLHTIKIRNNQSSQTQKIYGFEILNESANVNVRPGTAYQNNKKIVSSSASSVAYNSGTFDSVLQNGASTSFSTTRGGRVLTYIKSDGTIGKSAVLTNSAAAYLASADHTNEEIARTHHYREFGASRNPTGTPDDFSLEVLTSRDRAFTLDDGTTTLVGFGASPAHSSVYPTYGDGVVTDVGTSKFLTLTFVGTGLDITVISDGNASRSFGSISIDGGSSIGSYTNAAASGTKLVKIASGLPYGTHTVKFSNGSAALASPAIKQFMIYQPKKPSLPSGAVELADYNVMANYDGTTAIGTSAGSMIEMPRGTLSKMNTREFIYIGASWVISVNTETLSGTQINSGTSNSQPVSYSFFGTGASLLLHASTAGTFDFTVTIDGSLNASGVARANASNLGSGGYRSTSITSGAPCRVEFTGLSLGMHTISVQRSAGTGNFNFNAIHIITPIHSHKSNLSYDPQSTLLVGSQGISDNRKLTPVEDVQIKTKNIAQAIGVSSGPTTTSNTFIPCPDMSVTHYSTTGRIKISYSLMANTTGTFIAACLYMNGNQASNERNSGVNGSLNSVLADSIIINVPPNTVNRVDLYWRTSAASPTMTAFGTSRTLIVEEI